jgi:prepilin-type N-terminal cleavage/methylation domain-containing protein
MQKKKEKGFTLIELLIVIGIIAILAAAVIIAINPGQQFKQARNATRWSHMNSIVNATYSYVISSGGSFPPCGNPAALAAGENLIDVSLCSTDLADHIGDLPKDPQVGGASHSTTPIVINTVSYPVTACTGATCTGYVIGLLSGGSRMIVASVAKEATDEDIAVIQ